MLFNDADAAMVDAWTRILEARRSAEALLSSFRPRGEMDATLRAAFLAMRAHARVITGLSNRCSEHMLPVAAFAEAVLECVPTAPDTEVLKQLQTLLRSTVVRADSAVAAFRTTATEKLGRGPPQGNAQGDSAHLPADLEVAALLKDFDLSVTEGWLKPSVRAFLEALPSRTLRLISSKAELGAETIRRLSQPLQRAGLVCKDSEYRRTPTGTRVLQFDSMLLRRDRAESGGTA